MEDTSESGTLQRTFLWTRGVAAQQVLYYSDRNGIDAEPLLSKAELSRSVFPRPYRNILCSAESVPRTRRTRDE
jgi:hypothetical protein